jgi:hypothetical protein
VLNNFTGDKLKLDKILNTPIIVHDFVVEDSTVKVGTKRLKLQIEKNDIKHIFFTGSTILIQQIERLQKEQFPFTTTIVKESEHLEFT